MTICFFCGNETSEKKMIKERVAKKRICRLCYKAMENTEFMSREREVALMISNDAKGRADPKSGGRFKRHKG